MSLQERSVGYAHGDVALEGQLVWDDAAAGERPCVLVVHDAAKTRAITFLHRN